jgi:hypothetical protein
VGLTERQTIPAGMTGAGPGGYPGGGRATAVQAGQPGEKHRHIHRDVDLKTVACHGRYLEKWKRLTPAVPLAGIGGERSLVWISAQRGEPVPPAETTPGNDDGT